LFPEPPLGDPGDLGQVIQFGDHPKKRGTKRSFRPLNFFHFFPSQKPPSGERRRGTPWNTKKSRREFLRYPPRPWRHTSLFPLSGFRFPVFFQSAIRNPQSAQPPTRHHMPHMKKQSKTKKQNNIQPEVLRSTYGVHRQKTHRWFAQRTSRRVRGLGKSCLLSLHRCRRLHPAR
jgi:hypothetical protein